MKIGKYFQERGIRKGGPVVTSTSAIEQVKAGPARYRDPCTDGQVGGIVRGV